MQWEYQITEIIITLLCSLNAFYFACAPLSITYVFGCSSTYTAKLQKIPCNAISFRFVSLNCANATGWILLWHINPLCFLNSFKQLLQNKKIISRKIWYIYSMINNLTVLMMLMKCFRSENSESDLDIWINVYNDSNNEWIVEGILTNMNYDFRVRGYNEYGYSNFSYSEKPFYLPETGGNFFS